MSSLAERFNTPVTDSDFRLDIVRMNGSDPIHRAALTQQFSDIIEDEAKSFGAVFDFKKFGKVVDAVASGQVQAYFMIANWEMCRPHIIGASVQFGSAFTKWNGSEFDHYYSSYIEDVCVSPRLLSNFIRSSEAVMPHGRGLGASFVQELVRTAASNCYSDWPSGFGAGALVGEYDPNGKQIVKILNQFNAALGTGIDSGIFDVESVDGFFTAKNGPSGSIVRSALTPADRGHTFAVSWIHADGTPMIAATFTWAISSFSGESLVRAQITGNKKLFVGQELVSAVQAILHEGYTVSVEKEWIRLPTDHVVGASTPMRVHVLNEPEIIQALGETSLSRRVLGGHAMMPLIIDFSKLPSRADFTILEPARRLKGYDSSFAPA